MANNEVHTYPSTRAGTIREAAEAAAEAYAIDEIENHAQAIMDAWEAKLKEQTERYVLRAMQWARTGPEPELAEPVGPVWPLYPYWNLFLAGPFQPLGGPGGPFLPHKIIRAADPAFMLGAVWRNPACVNWRCPAPSACELMSGWTARIWLASLALLYSQPKA